MIEMFVERAAPGAVRGDHWRVSWYDAELRKFVGGEGGSAWEALAWAMVCREETRRGILVIARNTSDTPARVLARLYCYADIAADFSRHVVMQPNPVIVIPGGRATTGTPAQVIETSPSAALSFRLSTETAPKPSAAARRSRTTKAKKK